MNTDNRKEIKSFLYMSGTSQANEYVKATRIISEDYHSHYDAEDDPYHR
jgi:hypothetical protein